MPSLSVPEATACQQFNTPNTSNKTQRGKLSKCRCVHVNAPRSRESCLNRFKQKKTIRPSDVPTFRKDDSQDAHEHNGRLRNNFICFKPCELRESPCKQLS